METLTVEEAQDRLKTLICNISTDQCKYRISSNEGNAVLLSEESYQDLMITLEMLSTPMFFPEQSLEKP